MHDCGIGTFILFMILLAAMLINEWRKGNIIWDTSSWMIIQKSPADETAELIENYNCKYYITNREERKDV